MKLVETTLLSFVATSIKMLAALVINKAVAVYAGPNGIALIGQMQNAIQIANTFAQGGLNAGVTKYTAEYRNQPNKILGIWSSSLRMMLVCSFLVGCILIFLSNYISSLVLKDYRYGYVFVILGFTIVLFAINQLLLSVLNGLKEIKTLTLLNIFQSIYALVFTTILVIYLGVEGALIGLATNQSIVLFFGLYKLRNHAVITIDKFFAKWNRTSILKLLKFSGMALTSALLTPLLYMYIRNKIGSTMSWEHAGYWQSMIYISGMYIMVISIALNTYYLPRLSEVVDKKVLRAELLNGYKVIIPIVVLMSLAVYVSRELIVDILFSSDFGEVKNLFKWQLIGDVIKVAAFLLSFLMLAKAMTVEYIITEVVFCFLFAMLANLFVQDYGLIGVTYAYATNNFCYFITMIFLTKKVRY